MKFSVSDVIALGMKQPRSIGYSLKPILRRKIAEIGKILDVTGDECETVERSDDHDRAIVAELRNKSPTDVVNQRPGNSF